MSDMSDRYEVRELLVCLSAGEARPRPLTFCDSLDTRLGVCGCPACVCCCNHDILAVAGVFLGWQPLSCRLADLSKQQRDSCDAKLAVDTHTNTFFLHYSTIAAFLLSALCATNAQSEEFLW